MGSLRSPLPTGLRFVAECSGGSRPLRRPRTALVGYAVALVAASFSVKLRSGGSRSLRRSRTALPDYALALVDGARRAHSYGKSASANTLRVYASVAVSLGGDTSCVRLRRPSPPSPMLFGYAIAFASWFRHEHRFSEIVPDNTLRVYA